MTSEGPAACEVSIDGLLGDKVSLSLDIFVVASSCAVTSELLGESAFDNCTEADFDDSVRAEGLS